MSDSSEQSDYAAQRPALGDLELRLARRATEPLGVIDVRFAQRKYLRMVQWIAERTALADWLRSRYGIDEALADGEQTLAAPSQYEPQATTLERLSDRYIGDQLSMEGERDLTTRLTPDERTSVAGLEQVTGRRESLSTTNEEGHPVSGATPAHDSMTADSREAPPASFAQIIERASKAGAQTDREDRFRIVRRPPPLRSESGEASRADRPLKAPTEPAASSDEFDSSGVRKDVVFGASPDFVFKQPIVDASKAGAETPASQASLPNAPKTVPDTMSLATSASEGKSSHRSEDEDANSRSSPALSPVLRTKPVAAGETKVATTRELAGMIDRAAAVMRAGRPRSQGRGHSAISEVRDQSRNPKSPPEIIWRKGAAGSDPEVRVWKESGATTPGQPELGLRNREPGRDAEFGRDAGPGRTEQIAPPPASQQHPAELTIEQISPQVIQTISDRVMRAITLDLKIERERKGGSQWR